MIGLDEATPRRKLNYRLGCVALLLFLALGGWGSLSWIDYQAQQSLRYPDAEPITSHTIRTWNPPRLVEKRTFLTQDKFPLVYHWYSRTFDLGPEAAAMGTCIDMYGEPTDDIVPVIISVTLCQTQNGQRINVTRYINFR